MRTTTASTPTPSTRFFAIARLISASLAPRASSALLFVVFLVVSLAASAVVRPAEAHASRGLLKRRAVLPGARTACPPLGKCGLFKTPAGTPLVCKSCAAKPPASGVSPGKICDWPTGNCVDNGILGLGKPCQTNTQCNASKNQTCIADTSLGAAKGAKRCCRTTCPPGLCGAVGISYVTFCGQKLTCPAKCP